MNGATLSCRNVSRRASRVRSSTVPWVYWRMCSPHVVSHGGQDLMKHTAYASQSRNPSCAFCAMKVSQPKLGTLSMNGTAHTVPFIPPRGISAVLERGRTALLDGKYHCGTAIECPTKVSLYSKQRITVSAVASDAKSESHATVFMLPAKLMTIPRKRTKGFSSTRRICLWWRIRALLSGQKKRPVRII